MSQPEPQPSLVRYEVEVPLVPARAVAAVGEAAELWGASWSLGVNGGRLELPVTAGVRRGVVEGRVTVEATGDGSRVRFEPEASRYQVNRAAVMVLLFGAAGGLVAMAWPFWPPLLGLAPLAMVLAFVAWLLVASKLRSGGPEEFLAAVGHLAGTHEPPDGGGQQNAG